MQILKVRSRKSITDTKVDLVRAIIQEARTPLSAREISRRIMGKTECAVYHMLPPEVSAVIRIHLKDEIKSDITRSAGDGVLCFSLRAFI